MKLKAREAISNSSKRKLSMKIKPRKVTLKTCRIRKNSENEYDSSEVWVEYFRELLIETGHKKL